MAGIITHLALALISLIVIYFLHFKLEYALSIFVGNLLPDAINVIFSSLKHFTLNLFEIVHSETYSALYSITSDYTNWLALGFFILGLAAFFYHFHFIKKKKMDEYDELYSFLLLGIIIHLIVDALIIEHGYFI